MSVEGSPKSTASAHVVFIGNEKGGSGKSTITMHVTVALLKLRQRVATINLDSRQRRAHARLRRGG
jgi:chromosome partitioning protein